MTFKYFTSIGKIHRSRRIGYVSLFFSVVLFMFTLSIVYYAIQNDNLSKNWYWLFSLFGTFVNLRLYAQQFEIDIRKSTIVKSYFGIFKTEFSISNIENFEIIKHLYLFIHNGTDIVVVLNNDKKIKILERVRKTKNATKIIGEMELILNQNIK